MIGWFLNSQIVGLAALFVIIGGGLILVTVAFLWFQRWAREDIWQMRHDWGAAYSEHIAGIIREKTGREPDLREVLCAEFRREILFHE